MTKGSNPLISFVILTRNSEKTLKNCLQSIVAQGGNNEILVIDGNSVDRTIPIAQKFTNKVVGMPDNNLATARNEGIELARGQFIAFVDSDIILPLNWTDKLLDILTHTFSKKDNGVIAGISSSHKSRNPTLVACLSDLSMNLRPGTKFVDAIYFQSALFRADILKRFRSNSRWKRSGEDTDLSYQMRESNYLLMHTDEVVVEHYSPDTPGALLKKQFRYGLTFPQVLLKHPRFMTEMHSLWFIYFPVLLITSFNVFWFGAVFFAPYVMHIYRLWHARGDIDIGFGIVNGLKFQAHSAGVFVGLLHYIIRGRYDEDSGQSVSAIRQASKEA